MRVGIIGLPLCGKTTLFNALTRGHAEVGSSGGERAVNVGSAEVPDGRLIALGEMYHPERLVHADVTYADMPGPPAGRETDLFTGEAVNQLQQADALLLVARAFADEAVPHPLGSVDHRRDLEKVAFDLLFADIAIIDRRIERIREGMKAARAPDREVTERAIGALGKLQEELEAGVPVRAARLDDSARRALSGTSLLTSRPLLVALNIDEDDLPRAAELEAEAASSLPKPGVGVAAMCGKLEMELSGLDAAEEAEFRAGLGAGESGLDRMIRLSYQVQGLISFFTHGGGEVRAWTVPSGTRAVNAAGRVHSDMERGFIRAEVVSYDDLVGSGGWQEARKAGVLRREGRDYAMQDGDVVNFLFSI